VIKNTFDHKFKLKTKEDLGVIEYLGIAGSFGI